MDFQKTKNSIIRVQKQEYKGNQYYDFRTYYRDEEKEEIESKEEWLPTRKGFTISIDIIDRFIIVLNNFFDEERKKKYEKSEKSNSTIN